MNSSVFISQRWVLSLPSGTENGVNYIPQFKKHSLPQIIKILTHFLPLSVFLFRVYPYIPFLFPIGVHFNIFTYFWHMDFVCFNSCKYYCFRNHLGHTFLIRWYFLNALIHHIIYMHIYTYVHVHILTHTLIYTHIHTYAHITFITYSSGCNILSWFIEILHNY